MQQYGSRVVDWGSVPDWLAGAGAALALVFAGIAARTTNTQVRQLETQQRSSQAAGIAVWVSSEKNNDTVATVRYVNSSALPVYSVRLFWHVKYNADPGIEARAKSDEELGTYSYPVLGPLSGRRTLRAASKTLRGYLSKHFEGKFATLHEGGCVLVSVSFRDAAGAWWYRTAGGELCTADDWARAEAGARKPPSA